MTEDRFAELEDFYDDLSPNGQWLIDEVRRLRSNREAIIRERNRLADRLNDVWRRVSRAANIKSPDLNDMLDSVTVELQQLRGTEYGTPPLSDRDRTGRIMENVAGRVYDKQACEDINWLVREIGNVRALVKWVNQRLLSLVWINVTQKENTREIVATVHRHFRGMSNELGEIHDVLAKALEYKKAPTAEEDPDCPCPGEYITGEHTAGTLAAEAAILIKNLKFMNDNQRKTIQDAEQAIIRLRGHNDRRED